MAQQIIDELAKLSLSEQKHNITNIINYIEATEKTTPPTTTTEFIRDYPQSNNHLEHFYTLLKTHELEEKPHQIEGITWLIEKELQLDYKGGILADEMGLGKTLQCIGTIICNPKNNTLIVLPLNLLQQWNKYILTYTNIIPHIFHPSYSMEKTDSAITVTSYGMVSKKKEFIIETSWNRIICDEAHHLRNKNTTTYKAMKNLKADIFWFITGTPIQNKLDDLLSLLNIINYNTTKFKCYKKDKTNLNYKEELQFILKATILKRSKLSINLIIPELIEHNIYIDWNNEIEKTQASFSHKQLQNNITNDTENIVHMLRAKQSCIATNIIPTTYYPIDGIYTEPIYISTKIQKVYNTISINGFTKPKLIFCQYHGEIDKIYHILKHHHHHINIQIYDGRKSMKERKEILEQTNINILILQIQCGCEGLNLQNYKEVYIISPHWNPAIEDQAIARCHRIGQNEPVNVFRFFMNNFDEYTSMDTFIKQLQTKKRDLFW